LTIEHVFDTFDSVLDVAVGTDRSFRGSAVGGSCGKEVGDVTTVVDAVDVSGFVERFRRVLLADLGGLEALGVDGVAEVLASITVCRRVLDGREIACNRALDALADAGAGIDPDRVHAGVTGRSSAAASRSMRRARAAVAGAVGEAGHRGGCVGR
jgi:hypothetical protein